MKKLDAVDIQLIKETFSLSDWSVSDIAIKLECSEQTVRNYAREMGLKRPKVKPLRTPKLNAEDLWYLRKSGKNYEQAADETGCSVRYAKSLMKRMLSMTESERIMYWNRYRKANSMPLFTKC